MLKRKHITLLLFVFCCSSLFGQETYQNFVYAQRDTQRLSLDLYPSSLLQEKSTCIIFVFGGGFIMGDKREPYIVAFCQQLAKMGYTVAAIDYRLGLKGQKKVSVAHPDVLHKAILLAVEDLYSATNYLIKNADKLRINSQEIVLCGSSAGAITVLQADYLLCNKAPEALSLPSNFHYAGVISFAGAIFSTKWKPKYKDQAPAPTLFFHGMKDRLVTYKKIQLFNIGFFGTKSNVKCFEKNDYPYFVVRYDGLGHEIASIPMTHNLNDIAFFLEEFVKKQRKLKMDLKIKDKGIKNNKIGSYRPKDLYKHQ